jgi:hypothetical protein
LSGSQLTQLPPLVPQVVVERCWQTPSSQQPEAQFAEEHVTGPHAPPTQDAAPHCTQLVPPVPQAAEVSPATHEPFAQQPPQVETSQVAVTQPPSWQLRDGHVVQLPPPVPQPLAEVPGWHWPFASQQPVGHVLALHVLTQAFITHEPEPHDVQLAPFLPHAVLLFPPTHTPPWQQPPQLVELHALAQVWPVQRVPAAH